MADSNVFSTNPRGQIGQIISLVSMQAATKSDTLPIDPTPCRAIMVLADATVKVVFEDDSAAVTLDLLGGVLYPFAIKQVFDTGTDAVDVFVGY